ncbi:MAG TPA: glycosyltransferase family 39 protein [Solirubrobacterales bacterium]|nr:glycosyltransferase family 39 protein [Solirubrobacterales bacterium]
MRTAAVIGILLVGLGLRVGYAVEQPAARPPDAQAYARIAESLYLHGSFDARPPGASHEMQPASAYSPGLPLFVAAVYLLSGGVHLTLALVLLALLGATAIPMAYLLGRRFAGPAAGLIAAAAVAVYPALLEYQGLPLTEPLAAFLLGAVLVLFFRACDRPGDLWRWAGFGAVFGALAMVRPEYLVLAALLPLAWLPREARRGRPRRALTPLAVSLLATIVVLAPWTIRNAIVLGRLVPVSTGGGKALFIGTYLDAHGDGVQLRELLLAQRPALRARLARGGPVDDPNRYVLERVLARVAAARYPGLETDAALGRLGRQNLSHDLTDEPLRFAGMLAGKAFETWTDAPRATMEKQPWRTLQLAIVVLALIGLAALGFGPGRRFEALICALVLAYMTAVAALLIASPRRELVVLPLLAPLAGTGAVWLWGRLRGG